MTPNPYAAPPPGAPAPRPNRTPLILGLVAAAALCFCGVPMAFFAWSASLPESGVLAGNQVDRKTKALIAKRAPLGPDEEIVSFYDTTISVDGSECALLTTERLVYWTKDEVSQLAVDEITELRHDEVPLEGDVITAMDAKGRQVKVEVAPMNDGAAFLRALEKVTGLKANAGERHRGARAAEPEPTPAAEPTPALEPEPAPVEHSPATRKKRR